LPERLCAVGRARVGGRIAERAARALERVGAGRERVSATSLIEWYVPFSLVTHAERAPAAAPPGGRPVILSLVALTESAPAAALPGGRPVILSLVALTESAPAAALPGGRPIESASAAAWPSRPHLRPRGRAGRTCSQTRWRLPRACQRQRPRRRAGGPCSRA